MYLKGTKSKTRAMGEKNVLPQIHRLWKRNRTTQLINFTGSVIPLLLVALCSSCGRKEAEDYVSALDLPPGFHMEVFATNVPEARQLALTDSGVVFVGSRHLGTVSAVMDYDSDWKADEVLTIATGLRQPSGIALNGNDLYVAAIDRVLVYRDIATQLPRVPTADVVTDALPKDEHHGWKYLKFGPDGQLYFGVGAPCDSCLSQDARHGTIMRLDPASGELEIYARGVRNTLGFDWHPIDEQMWFAENGQDDLGDYLPPDEINLVETVGQNFGFPFYYGNNVAVRMPSGAVAPAQVDVPKLELTAHTAPLGMTFYRGQQFPSSYRNALFIAEHGSNGAQNIRAGYRLSLVRWESGSVTYEPLTPSWTFATLGSVLRGMKGYVWGRPTDVAEAPDGSLLISDDAAGAIYRLSYQPE